MNKRALLRFTGTLSQGFQIVVEIQHDRQTHIEAHGSLPANPGLAQALQTWQQNYHQWLRGGRISLEEVIVEPVPQDALALCKESEQALHHAMGAWLAQDSFRPIELKLRDHLQLAESVPLLLRTEETWLHQLPWQLWGFIQDYPSTEIIFGSQSHNSTTSPVATTSQVQLLAVFGEESRELDLNIDRQVLQGLPDAQINVLEQPTREMLGQQLWHSSSDIFFFAGHSHSREASGKESPNDSAKRKGVLRLNSSDLLELEALRHDLRRAIANGLHLAIFNSCDGLGLAYDLETLHIPQLVVMREPVPDVVAHAFLRSFTTAFANGKPLHLALREAREQLQRLENQYPGASGLPVLFQNPALEPITWQQLRGPDEISQESTSPQSKRYKTLLRQGWRATLLVSCLATALTMGSRYLGLLHTAELALYDHWLRSRPAEPQDDRIVVLGVDDADILAQPEAERQGRSLTDATLTQILQVLDSANPRLIGLDIYREQGTTLPALQRQFTQNSKLFGICKDGETALNYEAIAPPPNLPLEQVGFSNIRTDSDQVTRIQLLSSATPEAGVCPMDYSLAAILAEEYLFQSGFELTFSDDGETWQWGEAKLTRLGRSPLDQSGQSTHYGPYAKLDAQGHQVLLNYRASQIGKYRSPVAAFEQITVRQLLQSQGGEREQLLESLQDKIVLIGVIANASEDRWSTPYRNSEGLVLQIPGIHLHAQMLSQILSAALDGRKLLWSFPFWVDGIGVAGLTASVLILVHFGGGRGLVPWQRLLCIGGSLVFLYAGSVSSFRQIGLYLPWLPCALSISLGFLMDERLNAVKQQS